MELVSFAKEVLQNVAEQVASYRIGQSVLRHLDRALWVVEKCARWAVPPPLDQDDRPQPELIRPLPWVFFLALLIALRITRESISLINLALGKPPLRSADVVTYIQGKRRYLRTLKYQGNRMMRARTSSSQPNDSWFSGLHSLFEFTMCFRRNPQNYGNNNTTRVSNNDEILVVKRSNPGREESSPVASTSETTMERLIEKIMVDLDADSEDDSSYTLTNATSAKSDRSVNSDDESDQYSEQKNEAPTPDNTHEEISTPESKDLSKYSSTSSSVNISPEKIDAIQPQPTDESKEQASDEISVPQPTEPKKMSPKEESQKFIQYEKHSPPKAQQSPKREQKIGRKILDFFQPKSKIDEESKKLIYSNFNDTDENCESHTDTSIQMGGRTERRDSDVPVLRVTPADDVTDGGKENVRQSHQNDQ